MSPSPRSAPGAARALWWAMRRSRLRGGPKTSEVLKVLPRLVTATASGRYTGCSRGRLALMVAAAGYVVSPVDLLPEGLLGPIGLADDAAVLAWLAGALLSEGEAFLAWEREQQGAAGGSGPTGPAAAAGPRRDTRSTGSRGGGRRDDGRPDVVQGDVIR